MTYFSSNYQHLKYPRTEDGLRNAQIGAIFSIGAHFSLHTREHALVVLPTGSGKTAVLVMSAFVLQVRRVLVLSSSVLVRGQIVDEFANLTTLKRLKVLPNTVAYPTVKEITSPLKSLNDWEQLVNYNVVVGIPGTIYKGIREGIIPPLDLFDLILVDEAHHAPAQTWSGIIDYFINAKKILFTATPFRRDKQEVPGKLIYNYPLSKAKEDKVFGEIGYIPITPRNGESADLAIAKAAEAVFNQDKERGLKHYLLIRTNKKAHAKELFKLYKEKTKLNILKVDSSQTYAVIQKTIKDLKEKRLDGIICVNMLGEGFDFPNLKIAAIHSIHKSLAITLQFIGRFARTNANDIDSAKFLATPQDINIGKQQLYTDGAIWDELVMNLSEEKIELEDETKQVANSFELAPDLENEETEDFSLYNINPFFHVKVYSVTDFNLYGNFSINGHETIYHYISEENSCVVFITKETKKPKWLNSDDLVDSAHFIFLMYYCEEESLLFLHSSIRTPQFYDFLIKNFSNNPQRIAKEHINKVLANLTEVEFFNIGMESKAAASGESYKTITGPNAHNVIKASDGRTYSNGHIYAKAKDENNTSTTIGYSSGSKIWINAYPKINEYIKVCKILGSKINSDSVVKTNTGFDYLPVSKVVSAFPTKIYAATWDSRTFKEHPILYILNDDEIISQHQLLNFDIQIIQEHSTSEKVFLLLVDVDVTINLTYSFDNHFEFAETYENTFLVDEIDLLTYLNEYSLKFYLIDFSIVHHHELTAAIIAGTLQYDNDNITVFEWDTYNVDITKEYYSDGSEKVANGNKESIHEGIKSYLEKGDYDVIIYDHGSGEMADFITIKEYEASIQIHFYHAKKSGGQNEGDRVNDVYDVCGQAIKSLIWTTSNSLLLNKIKDRIKDKEGRKFIKGTTSECQTLLTKAKIVNFTIHIVQPGITKAGLSEKVSTVLASTLDYIRSNGKNEHFSVIASN